MRIAWHLFQDENGLPALSDGRPVVIGEWVELPTDKSFYASDLILDMLVSPVGPWACLLECGGQIKDSCTGGFTCTRARALCVIRASDVFGVFGRELASSVVHLWGASEVVRDYLRTGDELKREAARLEACAASKAASGVSALDYAVSDAAMATAIMATCPVYGVRDAVFCAFDALFVATADGKRNRAEESLKNYEKDSVRLERMLFAEIRRLNLEVA